MSDPCRVQIAKYGTQMRIGKKTKLEVEFAEADEDVVIDKFLDLLPTKAASFVAANARHPQKFVKKLRDIHSSQYVVNGAVSDYAGAMLMRMRWEYRRLERKRIKRLDQNLLSIYDSINDTLPIRKLSPKEEEARGRVLLDCCKARAEAMNVPGFTIDPSVAKGELQCIANGEGYEKREITWKRP